MAPDDAQSRVPDVTVIVTRSAGEDGAVVVMIDTRFEPNGSDGGPALRVLVNDDPVYEGKAYELTVHGRGVLSEARLEVALSEIEYEHQHDTGDYSDVQ